MRQIAVFFSEIKLTLVKINWAEDRKDMPLKMAPLGEEVEIKRLAADDKVKRHLENLGLAVGQKITVLSAEGGAVILKVKDGRMALDRQMSAGIFVAWLLHSSVAFGIFFGLPFETVGKRRKPQLGASSVWKKEKGGLREGAEPISISNRILKRWCAVLRKTRGQDIENADSRKESRKGENLRFLSPKRFRRNSLWEKTWGRYAATAPFTSLKRQDRFLL